MGSIFLNSSFEIMWSSAAIFLTFFAGLSTTCGACVRFYDISSDDRFTGLILDSGYLKQSRTSRNDKIHCGYNCIMMTDCQSFFLDTSTLQCQFHNNTLQDTSGLTTSANSLYFVVNLYARSCPNGWVGYHQYCYYFETQLTGTYDDAKADCSQIGGSVLRVENACEMEFIRDHLSTLSFTGVAHIWIGLIYTSNTWTWEDTGIPLTYSNWKVGQPQDNTEYGVTPQRNGPIKYIVKWVNLAASSSSQKSLWHLLLSLPDRPFLCL